MDTQLTSETVESLASKLDEFAQVLSDDEKAALLTIFRLGSSALDEVGRSAETESGRRAGMVGLTPATGPSGGGTGPTFPTGMLSRSIKDAFQPAIARGLTGINVAASGVEVTGGVKWSA